MQSLGETTWTSTTAPVLAPITPRNGKMMEKLRGGLGEYVRLFNPVATNWRQLTRNVERERAADRRRNIDRRKRVLAGRHSSIPEVGRYNFKREFGSHGDLPHLDILHSDNESDDDDVTEQVLPGVKTFRSLPNMTHRSGHSLGTQLATTSELSTISSGDSDVTGEESFYSARRDQMRSTLQLMGGRSLAKRDTKPAHARSRGSKTSTKRKRSAKRRARPGRTSDVSGVVSDSEVPSSRSTKSKQSPATSSKQAFVELKLAKAPLDVIAEAQASPDVVGTPVTSPSKARKSASTSRSVEVTNSEESKAASKLVRVTSKKSLDDSLNASGGGASLAKKGSVAALRAKRRRVSVSYMYRYMYIYCT